jgi:hypothetical protein
VPEGALVVKNMRVFAVIVVLLTVTVPATRVAKPILALLPSAILIPPPMSEISTFPDVLMSPFTVNLEEGVSVFIPTKSVAVCIKITSLVDTGSVITKLPAPETEEDPVEVTSHCCPPVELLVNEREVPPVLVEVTLNC